MQLKAVMLPRPAATLAFPGLHSTVGVTCISSTVRKGSGAKCAYSRTISYDFQPPNSISSCRLVPLITCQLDLHLSIREKHTQVKSEFLRQVGMNVALFPGIQHLRFGSQDDTEQE